MGARGPAPQKAELRILKGNGKDRDQAHKRVRRQPSAVVGSPAKPDYLGEYGADMWDRVAPELVRIGVLGPIDGGALEAYCLLYQQVRDHDGGRGFPTLVMAFLNAGSKLGLDPASRLRMTLPEARDDEEGDVFGESG